MFLLREMDVIINMILTEAVIPRTLGTVTELKLGIVGVRPAADRAFMRIEVGLLLPLYAL